MAPEPLLKNVRTVIMEIRYLREEDLESLLDLYKHLHQTDNPLPANSIVRDTWLSILKSGQFIYFGGFVEDWLVSSCTISLIPNMTRGCRPYGVIENVVTHVDYRGRGFGKQILAQALDLAWSQNCYKVMLMTGRKDESTFNFYKGAGFDKDAKQAFVAKPF